MKRSQFLGLMIATGVSSLGAVPSPGAEEIARPRCYELRVYQAAEGKLDALNSRFRDHTTQLFGRHGMTNIGYWTPFDNPQRLLIYLLSYPDLAAREASWKAFQADPEWISTKAASEANGPLIEKIESHFLTLTDFSPEMKVDAAGAPHTFEMRTYTATPGNLPLLLDRFRQHTVKLFSKHGMRHFGYFTPSVGQPREGDILLYFLVHASTQAQETSFSAFRADPEWMKVKSDSELAGGGSLTVPNGVKSVLLKATDYSPVR